MNTEKSIVCGVVDCTNEFYYSPPAGWVRFDISSGRGKTDRPEGFICPDCWFQILIKKTKNRPSHFSTEGMSFLEYINVTAKIREAKKLSKP